MMRRLFLYGHYLMKIHFDGCSLGALGQLGIQVVLKDQRDTMIILALQVKVSD